MFLKPFNSDGTESLGSRDEEDTQFEDEDYADALSRAGGGNSSGKGSQTDPDEDNAHDGDTDDDSFEDDFNITHDDIMRGKNALPSWVFDIEDDEDLELAINGGNPRSLLDELEIDLAQITFSVVWMLKSPFFFFIGGLGRAPSLANSRYAVLRAVSYAWMRIVDYSSHPIKISGVRRRASTLLRGVHPAGGTRGGAMSPASEFEGDGSSEYSASFTGASIDDHRDATTTTIGASGSILAAGSRNRSRTSSENFPPISNGNGSESESGSGRGRGRGAASSSSVIESMLWSGHSVDQKKSDSPRNSANDSSGANDGNGNDDGGEYDDELDFCTERSRLLLDVEVGGTDRAIDSHNDNHGHINEHERWEGSGIGIGLGLGLGGSNSDRDNNNSKINDNDQLPGFGIASGNGSADSDKPFDFWGPCGVVTGYCMMLWLAGQGDVSYVYVVWIMSSTFHHFTVRPFVEESTILFHMSIMGYSLVPLIPLVFLIVVSTLPSFVVTLTECIAVTWGSIAAIMSYKSILYPLLTSDREQDRIRLILLLPTVIIFQIYIIAFMPTRRWQINNGEALKIL